MYTWHGVAWAQDGTAIGPWWEHTRAKSCPKVHLDNIRNGHVLEFPKLQLWAALMQSGVSALGIVYRYFAPGQSGEEFGKKGECGKQTQPLVLVSAGCHLYVAELLPLELPAHLAGDIQQHRQGAQYIALET